MIGVIRQMMDSINSSQTDITAEYAYRSDPVKRPVTERRACFKVNEIHSGEIIFSILVFTPLYGNGEENVDSAIEICEFLGSEGFDIYNIVIGEVSYDGNSQGFVSEIKGSIFDGGETASLGGISLTAFNFSRNGSLTEDFFAEDCDYSVSESNYPIMTVFENEPFDVLPGEDEWKLRLRGVSEEHAVKLRSNGVFDLKIKNSENIFRKCRCESYNGNAFEKVDLLIRGVR